MQEMYFQNLVAVTIILSFINKNLLIDLQETALVFQIYLK